MPVNAEGTILTNPNLQELINNSKTVTEIVFKREGLPTWLLSRLSDPATDTTSFPNLKKITVQDDLVLPVPDSISQIVTKSPQLEAIYVTEITLYAGYDWHGTPGELVSLLSKTKGLEGLRLFGMELAETDIANLSLPSLSYLELDGEGLGQAVTLALLRATPNLEAVRILVCDFDNSGSVPAPLKLDKLSHLILGRCQFSGDVLSAIIGDAAALQKLEFSDCTISGDLPKELKLPALSELHIDGSRASAAFLLDLLHRVEPNIETLFFTSRAQLTESQISGQTFNFPQLKTLVVCASDDIALGVSSSYAEVFFVAAPQLNKFGLKTSFLSDPVTVPGFAAEIENIAIVGSTLGDNDLENIFSGAKNLKRLDLSLLDPEYITESDALQLINKMRSDRNFQVILPMEIDSFSWTDQTKKDFRTYLDANLAVEQAALAVNAFMGAADAKKNTAAREFLNQDGTNSLMLKVLGFLAPVKPDPDKIKARLLAEQANKSYDGSQGNDDNKSSASGNSKKRPGP